MDAALHHAVFQMLALDFGHQKEHPMVERGKLWLLFVKCLT